VLAWFHALLQERRTYIPQGWTKFYEFSPADLRSAADILTSSASSTTNPDWVTVHGLLGTAIYGGRVDNPHDERVLKAYLQAYFSNDVLNPNSKGPKRIARGVVLPTSASHSDYVAVIQSLSTTDTPSIFGLSPNADRAVQARNSAYVLQMLKTLDRNVDVAEAFDRERWAQQLTPLLNLWQKLVGSNDVLKNAAQHKADPVSGTAPPIEVFTRMEISRAHKLMQVVDESLAGIARVVRGAELLSAATQADGSLLIAGSVPSAWSSMWEGPEEPAVWIRAAVQRTLALGKWLQKVEGSSLLKEPMRLSELLSPHNLLTALRQQTARAAKCSMDGLRLTAALDKKLLPGSAAAPFAIDGLLLQAARMEPGGLVEVEGDSPTFSVMPTVHMAWIAIDERDPYPLDKSAATPIYLDPDRDQLLAEIRLPCAGSESQWIQAGVAIFLSEQDFGQASVA